MTMTLELKRKGVYRFLSTWNRNVPYTVTDDRIISLLKLIEEKLNVRVASSIDNVYLL